VFFIKVNFSELLLFLHFFLVPAGVGGEQARMIHRNSVKKFRKSKNRCVSAPVFFA